MIDINELRKNPEKIYHALAKRNEKFVKIARELYDNDSKYRKILIDLEKNNEILNKRSKEISKIVNKKSTNEANKIKIELTGIKKIINDLKDKSNAAKNEIDQLILSIPNITHTSVPTGKDENDNVEIKKWGTPTIFDFEPKAHWDLGKINNFVDFEHAVKLAGSRFTCYVKNGAKLLRALIQFTIDLNCSVGFEEYLPAVILNSTSLTGTGQLPKFEEDLFKLTNGYYLSPTAEVQLTNFYSHEILDESKLPIRLTANTACFRSEAGSASKDTKGVIRQHQFYKTEMVILSNPKNSYDEHEFMTRQAEKILEALKLPYRRIALCTGDIGFSAAKTYDIEVWLPSYNSYKEISSCSNCEAFQARRMMLRYKNQKTGKNEYVHTLNGSGLAIDRLWAAVVENYQQKDNSVKVPDVLKKYLNNVEYLK